MAAVACDDMTGGGSHRTFEHLSSSGSAAMTFSSNWIIAFVHEIRAGVRLFAAGDSDPIDPATGAAPAG
jgi:hypothetical protein